MMRTLIFRTGWAVFLVLVFLICGCRENSPPPRAVNGVLDLRNWDFEARGPLPLAGEWQFFWQCFVMPQDLGMPNELTPSLINAPGAWNQTSIQGQKIKGHGFATYALKILLPPGHQRFSLKTLDMATAFRLFVNGKEIVGAGIPGKTSVESVPQYLPTIVDFEGPGSQMDLVVHVSNFHHWQGGMWEAVFLGLPKDIHAMQNQRMGLDLFLLGAILIMCLYQIGLYGARRQNRSALYFGLFNFFIALRLMTCGERILVQAYDGLNYRFLLILIYLSVYWSVPIFILYARSLFPKEVSSRAVRLLSLTGLGFSMVVMFTPTRIFSLSMPYFQVITIGVLGYGMWAVGKAVANRRKGSLIFILGFLFISLTVVNDILYTRQVIFTIHLVPLGLFVFIFSQALLLSNRFSHAFSMVEKQSVKLSVANTAYEAELDSRTRAEAELNASKEQYQKLIQDSPDGVCIIKNEKIEYVNLRFVEMAGATRQEVEGSSFIDFIHPLDREKTIARYSSAVATKEVIGTFHVRGKDKQDRTRYLDLSASLIQWENKSAILCFVRDVTEQVQTRELLIQSEKMLSVGGLAAGMAHEINNPLAGMVQSAQVVVNRLAPGLLANDKTALDAGTTMDAIKVYAEKRGILRLLDNMLLAGKNAAEIVDNMLSFAQKPGLEKQSWDLSAVLDKTLRLVRTDFTLKDGYDFKKINIRKQVEPGVKKALCEESKIRQVLLNLFKNAAQAMAEEEENKSPEINVCIFQKEERCCISVEDNGPGMEETVRKRIFEPFYSTKETSAGTGLGLSVSYFIVTEDHEGQMDVVSTPGQGTKFTICLPADQEKA